MKIKNCLVIFYAVLLYSSIQETSANVLEIPEPFRINFDVTVIVPMCNFAYSSNVDFAEIGRWTLRNTQLLQPINLTFTDCSADRVEIGFTGKNIDYNNNYIANNVGQGLAGGVAIKLLDSGKRELSLAAPYITDNLIQEENINHDVSLFAQLIPISSSEEVTSGEIRTSIDLSVIYK